MEAMVGGVNRCCSLGWKVEAARGQSSGLKRFRVKRKTEGEREKTQNA